MANNIRTAFRAYFIALLLPIAGALAAQSSVHLTVAPADRPALALLLRDFEPRLTPADTLVLRAADSAALLQLQLRLLDHFRANAHLAASIDSVRTSGPGRWTGSLYLGPVLRWVRPRPADAATARWLDAVRFREKKYAGKPLAPTELLSLQRRLLEAAENAGYPFAAVQLDSVQIQADGSVDAVLRLTPGRYFTFGRLNVQGDLRLPPGFLPNYLGLKPGMPYSRARVLGLRPRLQSLLFAETTAIPSVTFAGNEAAVNLFLNKKRNGRFDFIIGLLPQPDDPAGRLLLTGSLSAAFQNALNLGERLSVELERLRPETQKLDVQAGLPYAFGTPFGLDGRLNIFRRDTTWVDAQGELGVQYLFAGSDYVKFFWENRSLFLQQVDTALVRSTRRLPPNLDMRQNGFGLEGAASRLDYRFNPRQGWAASLRVVAGLNNILRNSRIEAIQDPLDPEFRYTTLYDTVAGRVARFRLEGRAEGYVPLFARATLKLALRAQGFISEKPIYNNEQYRLGGNKLLRGFNEESLFASRFAVATAELRLLIGQNSYLAAFTDYGYVENITDRTRVFLRPWGLGAGLNFETQAGIFGISAAVGRQDVGESPDFRAVKFHIGYVSLF